ncbi:MAG: hypothetical protein KC668_28660 [Myxococcales bacterium]|nr:hypothetical protein [Myxococcales bacterium]
MDTSFTHDEWKKWTFKRGAEWTEWHALSPEVVEANVPTGPGVYVLGLGQRKRGVARLLGVDVHSVLDVGESGALRRRLLTLHRCVSTPGQTGHMAGWRLGTQGLLERMGVTVGQLRVSWCPVEDKRTAYGTEGQILQGYYHLFGELPPLNYKFNWATLEEDA